MGEHMSNYQDRYEGIQPCRSFAEFIRLIGEKYENRIAFQTHSMQWTYRELYELVKQCSAYFAQCTKKYICIQIDSPLHFCAVFFSVVITGHIAVLGKAEQFPLEDMEQVDGSVFNQMERFDGQWKLPDCAGETEVSVIALSSGTTSVAKGVMLSQYNLLSDTFAGAIAYGYPQGAVYLNILPYTHLFGIVADLLGPLASGGTICFSDNKLNLFRDMQEWKPTHMNLPPAVIYTIEKAIAQSQNAAYVTGGRLRKIMCAGAAIEDGSVRNMEQQGILVLAAYGLTECAPCISMNTAACFRLGSVGKILPCCEVQIREHEILVRGDNVMVGYCGDAAATAAVIKDGWLHTGDLGYLDEDGFLFLLGRKSNVIVLETGEKVIPETIETELNEMDGVEESLIQAANRRQRVLLRITVVASANPEHLKSNIQKCVEKHHLLNRLEKIVITTTPLPRNVLGKLLRGQANIS